MKVLVVDDSVVFRSQIKSALETNSEFSDIDVAANGKIAITKMQKSEYDLVILDIEMPEMNGIETLKEMKSLNINYKVIVFSSLTARGASATMEALNNGACDFVTKPQNLKSFDLALQHVKEQLIPKALQFTGKSRSTVQKIAANDTIVPPIRPVQNIPSISKAALKLNSWKRYTVPHFISEVCVIGCSTGGPIALKELFSRLKGPIKHPILITQHMPPVFTKTLAKSIEDQTGIPTKEAKHFEPIENQIYVAPGDFHLTLKESNGKIYTVLDKREKRCSVRPAVDYLFESAADVYGSKALGIVLTGMGSDGLEGSKYLKDRDGCVLIQDEQSSLIWGMPGSIYKAGAFDQVESLANCCNIFTKLLGRDR